MSKSGRSLGTYTPPLDPSQGHFEASIASAQDHARARPDRHHSTPSNMYGNDRRCFLELILSLDSDSAAPGASRASPGHDMEVLRKPPNVLTRGE